MAMDGVDLEPACQARSIPAVSVVMPILIIEPWQANMTVASIMSLYDGTKIPFELIVVETASRYFAPPADRLGPVAHEDGIEVFAAAKIDKYIHVEEVANATADVNRGIRAATGSLIVYTGNDIFVKPNWLEAMLDCFVIKDCGAATLGAQELGHEPVKTIMEGFYGPIMMFRQGWEYDAETFPHLFADADLVMRIYEAGFRCYRNHSVVVTHPNQQTDRSMFDKGTRDRRFTEAKDAFIRKHHRSNKMMFRGLIEGWKI